jgi:predicted TIM-barrel fold metal-dependent hydrolase
VTLVRSELHEAALAGEPLLGVEIVDAHAHLLPQRTSGVSFRYVELEQMLAAMDRMGIDRACISVLATHEANAEMLEAVTRYPDRFVGFVLVNPRYPDEIEKTLEWCFENPGVRGIGEVHPTSYQHWYPVTGPAYEPAWEFAAKHGVPVLIHSGPTSEAPRCSPTMIGEVARRHPGFPILIGHCGAYDSWLMLDEAIDVALEHEQVYLEICAMGRFYGALEHIVKRLGPDKVVFGTDAPFHDWTAEVAHVAFAKLSDEDKEKIFGRTMRALLGEAA